MTLAMGFCLVRPDWIALENPTCSPNQCVRTRFWEFGIMISLCDDNDHHHHENAVLQMSWTMFVRVSWSLTAHDCPCTNTHL